MDRAGAIAALERARLIGPTVEGLLDLALAYHLAGDVGAEVSAAEAATRLDPDSQSAWSSLRPRAGAHRPGVSECIEACRRALALGDDPEVADLLARVEAAQPRALSERTAASPPAPHGRATPPTRDLRQSGGRRLLTEYAAGDEKSGC